MRIHCDCKEFSNVVKKISRIAPTQSPVPELTGILLSANEETGEVTFTVTNQEVSVHCTLQASVEIGGSCVVNARILSDMLILLGAEKAMIELLPNGLLHVVCGKTQYTITALARENYPKLQLPQPESMTQVPKLCQLLNTLVFAGKAENGNSATGCVSLQLHGNSVRAIGTDYSQLMLSQSDCSESGEYKFLVPAKSLKLLMGMLDANDAVFVGLSGKQVVFSKPGFIFVARQIEGAHIDVDRIVEDTDKTYTAIVEASSLRQEMASACVVSNEHSQLQIAFSENTIDFTLNDGVGAYHSRVPAQVLAPMPRSIKGFFYNVNKLWLASKLMDGQLAIFISKQGVMLIGSENQTYMQVAMREHVRKQPKVKAETEKKTKTKKAKAA